MSSQLLSSSSFFAWEVRFSHAIIELFVALSSLGCSFIGPLSCFSCTVLFSVSFSLNWHSDFFTTVYICFASSMDLLTSDSANSDLFVSISFFTFVYISVLVDTSLSDDLSDIVPSSWLDDVDDKNSIVSKTFWLLISMSLDIFLIIGSLLPALSDVFSSSNVFSTLISSFLLTISRFSFWLHSVFSISGESVLFSAFTFIFNSSFSACFFSFITSETTWLHALSLLIFFTSSSSSSLLSFLSAFAASVALAIVPSIFAADFSFSFTLMSVCTDSSLWFLISTMSSQLLSSSSFFAWEVRFSHAIIELFVALSSLGCSFIGPLSCFSCTVLFSVSFSLNWHSDFFTTVYICFASSMDLLTSDSANSDLFVSISFFTFVYISVLVDTSLSDDLSDIVPSSWLDDVDDKNSIVSKTFWLLISMSLDIFLIIGSLLPALSDVFSSSNVFSTLISSFLLTISRFSFWLHSVFSISGESVLFSAFTFIFNSSFSACFFSFITSETTWLHALSLLIFFTSSSSSSLLSFLSAFAASVALAIVPSIFAASLSSKGIGLKSSITVSNSLNVARYPANCWCSWAASVLNGSGGVGSRTSLAGASSTITDSGSAIGSYKFSFASIASSTISGFSVSSEFTFSVCLQNSASLSSEKSSSSSSSASSGTFTHDRLIRFLNHGFENSFGFTGGGFVVFLKSPSFISSKYIRPSSWKAPNAVAILK